MVSSFPFERLLSRIVKIEYAYLFYYQYIRVDKEYYIHISFNISSRSNDGQQKW